jgi:hypothetical protein
MHVLRVARRSMDFWTGPSVTPPCEGQGLAGEPFQGSCGRSTPQTRPARQSNVQPFNRAAFLAKAAEGQESRPRSHSL